MGENMKQLKARVVNKHKTEAEWLLDVYTDASCTTRRDNPFIPLNGELIIFDADANHEKRFKFGDGQTDVIALPFVTQERVLTEDNVGWYAEKGEKVIATLDPSKPGVYSLNESLNIGDIIKFYGDYAAAGSTDIEITSYENQYLWSFYDETYYLCSPYHIEVTAISGGHNSKVTVVKIVPVTKLPEKYLQLPQEVEYLTKAITVDDVTSTAPYQVDINGNVTITGPQEYINYSPNEVKVGTKVSKIDFTKFIEHYDNRMGDPSVRELDISSIWNFNIEFSDGSRCRYIDKEDFDDEGNMFDRTGILFEQRGNEVLFIDLENATPQGYYNNHQLIYDINGEVTSVNAFNNAITFIAPYEGYDETYPIGECIQVSGVKITSGILHAQDMYISGKKVATEEYVDNKSIENIRDGAGVNSIEQGDQTQATGNCAVAEGYKTLAEGDSSHAEGSGSKAIGEYSHAEGRMTTASGIRSHTEGTETKADGHSSHAEGRDTLAKGDYSHAEGRGTKAQSEAMHVQGKYNATNFGYAHVVGWGEDENNRKDIYRLDTKGNAQFAGNVYGANGEYATKKYVDGVNGKNIANGSATGALRQSNLTLDIKSIKVWDADKLYIADDYCWYDVANNTASPDWQIYKCTSSSQNESPPHYPAYWELVDTSAEDFNFDNLNIPAKGYNPKAEGIGSIALGYNTKAFGRYSMASGHNSIANKAAAHAEGYQTFANANASHTEGTYTKTYGDNSHAEGTNSLAGGHDAHAEGTGSAALSSSAHTEGYETVAGNYITVDRSSIIELDSQSFNAETTYAKGTVVKYQLATNSSATYLCPTANIPFSTDTWDVIYFLREDPNDSLYDIYGLPASQQNKSGEHAEGYRTVAKGNGAHAEGNLTQAVANYAHAEGNSTVASDLGAHAEGARAQAIGPATHAEGADTVAKGSRAHAEGEFTIANGKYQHVQGKYNIADTTNAHIVGNGSSSKRTNAHTLDWDGNAWFQGDVYVGSDIKGNKDTGSRKLATEEYVDTAVGRPEPIIFPFRGSNAAILTHNDNNIIPADVLPTGIYEIVCKISHGGSAASQSDLVTEIYSGVLTIPNSINIESRSSVFTYYSSSQEFSFVINARAFENGNRSIQVTNANGIGNRTDLDGEVAFIRKGPAPF